MHICLMELNNEEEGTKETKIKKRKDACLMEFNNEEEGTKENFRLCGGKKTGRNREKPKTRCMRDGMSSL